jgi:hypothetical protein
MRGERPHCLLEFAFLATLILLGCDKPPSQPAGARYLYYVRYLNKTGHEINGVRLFYGDKEVASARTLVVGADSSEGEFDVAVPAEAEIKWLENGTPRSAKTKLVDAVPADFRRGDLVFVINPDGTVRASALSPGDTAGLAGLKRGLRPAGEYRLGFVNKTGRDLEAVSLYYGEGRAGGVKEILARVRVDYSGPLLPPIPSEAEVRWKEGGVPHAVKASLEGVPDGFEGVIYFLIRADGIVEVRPIRNGDDNGAFDAVK